MSGICKAAKVGAILASFATACAGSCMAEEEAVRDQAQRILDMVGINGGLIVHLGCGDGRLTAALGQSGRFVVHGPGHGCRCGQTWAERFDQPISEADQREAGECGGNAAWTAHSPCSHQSKAGHRSIARRFQIARGI